MNASPRKFPQARWRTRFHIRLLVCAALLGPLAMTPERAYAGEGPLDDAHTALDDDYSKVSVQKLLLRSSVKSTLGPKYVSAFYRTIGMKNFTIQDWGLNDQRVKRWCENTAKDMQFRKDETDTQGEANLTLQALETACGKIYSHALSLKHACKTVTRNVGTKKKPKKKNYRECSLKASMTIAKYAPEFSGEPEELAVIAAQRKAKGDLDRRLRYRLPGLGQRRA